jgi:hypothetical protein
MVAGPVMKRMRTIRMEFRKNDVMFGDGFEQSTILRCGADGLTRVITRTSRFLTLTRRHRD